MIDPAVRAANFYTSLSDSQLLGLLRVSEGRLSRRAVDEFLRRRQIVPSLASMALSERDWRLQGPLSWAPVHATFILGALGGAGPVLVEAMSIAAGLRVAAVTDVIDEIIGAQGPEVWEPLLSRLSMPGESDEAKGLAAGALAALAVRFPQERDRVRARLTAIVEDAFARPHLRESAASGLLRLRDPRDRALLEHWTAASTQLDAAAVASAYETEEEPPRGPSWLSFYDEAAVQTRTV
jgi:hypothetical protein